jgi:hypothetical protein
MALAGRANTAKACSWPKTDDANVALAYIDKIREPARQEQFKKAFNLMSSGKGPDDRADCTKLRAKIEASAKAARKTLGF